MLGTMPTPRALQGDIPGASAEQLLGLADAYAHGVTGKAGVSRHLWPGATNLVTGIANAMMDPSPARRHHRQCRVSADVGTGCVPGDRYPWPHAADREAFLIVRDAADILAVPAEAFMSRNWVPWLKDPAQRRSGRRCRRAPAPAKPLASRHSD